MNNEWLMEKLKMGEEWRDLPTMADIAAAQVAGDEIEVYDPANDKWEAWKATVWFAGVEYRARSVSKTKKVKILGWVDVVSGKTFTAVDGWAISGDAIRYPKLDDEIEVPE